MSELIDPIIGKAKEKPKPLTNDQKNQNVIYMRCLKKFWKDAVNEMNERLEQVLLPHESLLAYHLEQSLLFYYSI
jgi:hypothetical protein